MVSKAVYPQKRSGKKDREPKSSRTYKQGGLMGTVQFLTNRENMGEDNRRRLTIYKPMGNRRGGEQIKQTNGASNIRGFSRLRGRD